MYSKLYRNFLEPLWEEKIRKRKTLEYERKLSNTQWLDTSEILSMQWRSLQELLRHSEQECAYWKKTFRNIHLHPNDINSYEDFLALPITTKATIREHYDDMIAASYRGKTLQKITGGSTGEPLRFEYTHDSNEWRQAVTRRGYGWAGAYGGTKQAYIWGINLQEESLFRKFKQELHHQVLRQKYFNSFDFGEQEMERCRRALEKYSPAVIVGYANPLYNFAQYINTKASASSIRPQSVITGAEKLHDFQRDEIEKAFKTKVFNTYGSREFMLIAMECEQHNGLHISTENLFVEILRDDGSPADAGEFGRVVVTDLHNYGMPFIRYEIGDLAIRSNRACSCGRGLPILEDIVGRSLDMIKTPGGKMIPGEFFPHLLKDFSWIQRFQVIQDKLDSLTIKMVSNHEMNPDEFDLLKKKISKVMGADIHINYKFVDDIPLTKSGKHRVTISNIAG